VAQERRRRGKSRSGTVVLDEPVGGEGSGVTESRQAYLILIHPPGMEIGRRIALDDRDVYSIGRDAEANISLERGSISRQHASLVRGERGHWKVVDSGSTNGTFVNERQVDELTLKNGDQLRFGDVVFKFLLGGNIESVYHEEVYQLSVLDSLTGIHNRRYFLDFLDRELASAHRHSNPLTLAMMDIDHFKAINDERGHLCGDAVLKQLAERIRPRIRREDLFARYGGEEFAVILTMTGLAGGVRFAENVRQMVGRRTFLFEKQQLPVTVSLGVTTMENEPELDPASLIQRADQRLYEAKRGGRNRVEPPLADLRK
jgi:two-component system cell cycle response regulator